VPADPPPAVVPPIRVGQEFDARPVPDEPARPLVLAEVVLCAR
jgi:hypothetical protein